MAYIVRHIKYAQVENHLKTENNTMTSTYSTPVVKYVLSYAGKHCTRLSLVCDFTYRYLNEKITLCT